MSPNDKFDPGHREWDRDKLKNPGLEPDLTPPLQPDPKPEDWPALDEPDPAPWPGQADWPGPG
jgi:hypothetical protein